MDQLGEGRAAGATSRVRRGKCGPDHHGPVSLRTLQDLATAGAGLSQQLSFRCDGVDLRKLVAEMIPDYDGDVVLQPNHATTITADPDVLQRAVRELLELGVGPAGVRPVVVRVTRGRTAPPCRCAS